MTFGEYKKMIDNVIGSYKIKKIIITVFG